MVNYVCDRCGQDIHRRDLRSGRVEHLVDSSLTFELCFNCHVSLKCFLTGSEVPALMPGLVRGQGDAEKPYSRE